MSLKNFVCIISVFILGVSIIYTTANINAMENKSINYEEDEEILNFARATGRFNMDISPKILRRSDTICPLETGEVVTITASYYPASAKVDFGLISPTGVFYHFKASNGTAHQKIEITKRGNYVFAIRNNSSYQIHVSGYVTY